MVYHWQISLKEISKDSKKNSISMMYSAECTMECKPQTNCNGCEQEIITRCQSQSCTCNSGIGGCTSSISYGGDRE